MHILFALATQLDLEIVQFHVKTAFLYGKLEKPIYIKIPVGLELSGNKKKNMVAMRGTRSFMNY